MTKAQVVQKNKKNTRKTCISGFVATEVEKEIQKLHLVCCSKYLTFSTQPYSYQLLLVLTQYLALLWWWTPRFIFNLLFSLSTIWSLRNQCYSKRDWKNWKRVAIMQKSHPFHFFSQIVNGGLEFAPSTIVVVPQQQIHHSPFREFFPGWSRHLFLSSLSL